MPTLAARRCVVGGQNGKVARERVSQCEFVGGVPNRTLARLRTTRAITQERAAIASAAPNHLMTVESFPSDEMSRYIAQPAHASANAPPTQVIQVLMRSRRMAHANASETHRKVLPVGMPD